ncbi:hypothetical protein [Streptomyces sp. NPDC055107]
MPTSPTPAADRPADQLRDCLTAAVVETMQPRYGGPQHNTPGGLSLTATAEEIRLHRARPIVEAVLTALPAPALAVARQLLGTTETEGSAVPCPTPETHNWGCGCPSDVAAAYASCPGYEMAPSPCRCPCYGCEHNCAAHQPPAAPPAPADRAAVLLREAADAALAVPTPDCAEMSSLTGAWEAGQWTAVAAVRRLADGAAAGVQPPTSDTCTCADAGPEFAPAGHYADCPAAPAAPEEPTR